MSFFDFMKHSLFLDGWIEIGSFLDKVWIGAVLCGRGFQLFLKMKIAGKGSIYKLSKSDQKKYEIIIALSFAHLGQHEVRL